MEVPLILGYLATSTSADGAIPGTNACADAEGRSRLIFE